MRVIISSTVYYLLFSHSITLERVTNHDCFDGIMFSDLNWSNHKTKIKYIKLLTKIN